MRCQYTIRNRQNTNYDIYLAGLTRNFFFNNFSNKIALNQYWYVGVVGRLEEENKTQRTVEKTIRSGEAVKKLRAAPCP